MSNFIVNLLNVAKASDLLLLEDRVQFLENNPETLIVVVSTYADLPNPTTVTGQFYWVENSSGTSWLPGSLGGTYRQKGLYYSNGVTWEFTPAPFQATQSEVNAGTNDNKFVTPLTLEGIKPITQSIDTVEDARKISVLNRTQYNAIVTKDAKAVYLIEEDAPIVAWERYVDTVNTQTLTGATPNTFDITGSQLASSSLSFIDATTNKITPISLSDFIQVDLAFTAVTPTGTNNCIEIQMVVNGVVYRAFTHLFVKGSGVDDTISISFGAAIEPGFLVNGATFILTPNTGVTIKNKYISVIRLYKDV